MIIADQPLFGLYVEGVVHTPVGNVRVVYHQGTPGLEHDLQQIPGLERIMAWQRCNDPLQTLS